MCFVHLPDIALHSMAGVKSVVDGVTYFTAKDGSKITMTDKNRKGAVTAALNNMKDQVEAARLRQLNEDGQLDQQVKKDLAAQHMRNITSELADRASASVWSLHLMNPICDSCCDSFREEMGGEGETDGPVHPIQSGQRRVDVANRRTLAEAPQR